MEDSHVAVLIEDLRGQFRVFGEALEGVRQDVAVLKSDVAELKADVAGLKTDVTQLKVEMGDVKERVVRIEDHLNGAPVRRRRRSK